MNLTKERSFLLFIILNNTIAIIVFDLKVDSEVVTDLYHRTASAAWPKEYFPKMLCSATIFPLHKNQ